MDPIPLVLGGLPEPAWTGGVELGILRDHTPEFVERLLPFMDRRGPV